MGSMIAEWEAGLETALRGLETGSPMAFVIVFVAGVVASFTPCVYPLIPITISVIGAQARKGTKDGFFLALFYALGIALTYSLIGMAFAALKRFAGMAVGTDDIQKSPWVAWGISVICMLFAMVMFDKLTIPMPSKLQAWQGQRRGGSYLGALAAGLAFGTVASPCLAPVVGLIGLQVGQSGNIALGGAMLFTFGLGLGMLFIVIGTFAGAAQSLPKAGSWMDRIKNVFGWVMIAIALAYAAQAGALRYEATTRAAMAAAPAGAAAAEGYVLAPSQSLTPLTIPRVGEDPMSVGAPAPDAALTAPDGSATSLSALWREKALVLVFFASWCRNCPMEVPLANALMAAKSDAAHVIGVGATDALPTALAWAKEHGVRYDLLFDPDGALLEAYHPEDASGLPWVVVIARDGTLLYRHVSWPKNVEELVDQGFAAEPAQAAAPVVGESAPAPESATSDVAPEPTESEPPAPGEGPYEVLDADAIPVFPPQGRRAPEVGLRDETGLEFTIGDWRGMKGILFVSGPPDDEASGDRIERLLSEMGDLGRYLKVIRLPDDATKPLARTDAPRYALIDLDGNVLHLGEWPENAKDLAMQAIGEW